MCDINRVVRAGIRHLYIARHLVSALERVAAKRAAGFHVEDAEG